MRKTALILAAILLFILVGCDNGKEKLYLPESKNDRVDTYLPDEKNGGDNSGEESLYEGEGYTLSVPKELYRYERDYDDGALEEKWERTQEDDVKIKVITYKNTDVKTAQEIFLREHDDYIFENLESYPACGKEHDGDVLWFNLYESGTNVYIIAWEYTSFTNADIKEELSNIASTFKAK